MQINKRNLPVKFIGFAAILLILIFIVENINGRFWLNDFKVYCGGALAFLHGEPVYGVLFALGSGYFKYSPFTSILFIPLSLLPYTVACVIHYFVLSGAIIGTFLVLWHIINSYLFSRRIKNANVLLSLAFVCILVHIVRELHLGNINVVLLFALSLSLLFILKSRMVWAGILLAVVIITKPFLILLFIPLILRKHIKLLFATGASLLLFVLVPAIFTGISGDIALHKDWIHTMLEHNADFPSNHTIENIIRLYISPGLASVFSFYILAAVCIGIAILILMNLSLEKKEKDNNQLHN
jgi:hypothetical protein